MSSIPFTRRPLGLLLLAMLAQPYLAQADDDATAEEVTIWGLRQHRASDGATGLSLSLFETPQSVSQIDSDWINKLGFDDINDVLRFATGVNVEEVETDRTYYNSRGFDIKSMQVDGIGLPFNWNVVGMLDTAMYEKVEIIRGANGLLTGTGNPSGTINYVRKRPKSEFAASLEASVGSWQKSRLEMDLSTPLTATGSWAARVIVAAQEGESQLDLYEHKRQLIYGIVDGQLSDNATVAFGFSKQDSESDGVLWGALPLIYGNGEQTDFDVGTSTTMKWTYWDTHSKTSFVELNYALPADWQLKTVLTFNQYDEPSELFYVYASPSLDANTGLGLYGWPGKYVQSSDRRLFDATVSGQIDLAGRSHDLLFGLNMARADQDYWRYDAPASDPAWGALPAFPNWSGNEVARPAFGAPTRASEWRDDVQRIYAISRWHLSDAMQLIAGFNSIEVETKGYSFGETMAHDASETSPYFGLNYLLSPTLNAYFSYSDIYEPQPELDSNQQPIGSAIGNSYEAGIKTMWFDNQLLASVALFRAEQENYAEYAGLDTTTGMSYYAGVDVDSEGFELEASGQIGDRWRLLAGFTQLDLNDANGDDARTFVPRKTFNLGARFTPASLSELEIGGSVRWQDEVHIEASLGRIEQAAYATVSAYASYQINSQVELTLNLDNLTDEKYLTSLYWDQAFYGAPRRVALALDLSF